MHTFFLNKTIKKSMTSLMSLHLPVKGKEKCSGF